MAGIAAEHAFGFFGTNIVAASNYFNKFAKYASLVNAGNFMLFKINQS